jgi:hypothetical protein
MNCTNDVIFCRRYRRQFLQWTIKWSSFISSATGGNKNDCHGNQHDDYVNLILNAAVKEFWKSVNIYLRYGRKHSGPFFDSQCIYKPFRKLKLLFTAPLPGHWQCSSTVHFANCHVASLCLQYYRVKFNWMSNLKFLYRPKWLWSMSHSIRRTDFECFYSKWKSARISQIWMFKDDHICEEIFFLTRSWDFTCSLLYLLKVKGSGFIKWPLQP